MLASYMGQRFKLTPPYLSTLINLALPKSSLTWGCTLWISVALSMVQSLATRAKRSFCIWLIAKILSTQLFVIHIESPCSISARSITDGSKHNNCIILSTVVKSGFQDQVTPLCCIFWGRHFALTLLFLPWSTDEHWKTIGQTWWSVGV